MHLVDTPSDMVKRLINKMDFDALEVKMKKCKVRSGGGLHCPLMLYMYMCVVGAVLPAGRF